jgi:hypothetical protein
MHMIGWSLRAHPQNEALWYFHRKGMIQSRYGSRNRKGRRGNPGIISEYWGYFIDKGMIFGIAAAGISVISQNLINH